jgi:short subunit dehydrogenase-like uncharacterized protein
MNRPVLLIYGATGYTGGLIAEAARLRGVGCVVPGGRSEATLRPLAGRPGLPDITVTGVTLQDRS